MKNDIPFLILDSNRDVEFILCRIGCGANKFRLTVYYRPPNAREQHTERLCNEQLKRLQEKK